MKKLSSTIYNKLILQAEEANIQGKEKLATAILSSVGSFPDDSLESYAKEELDKEIYNGLWSLATNIIRYHDVNSVDAGKLHKVLESLAGILHEEVSLSIDVNPNSISHLEPKLIGQK